MKATAAVLLGSAVLWGALAHQARAFDWVENEIGMSYGPTYSEPGVTSPKHPNGAEIEKWIVSITHVDGFKYGTNFINVDILKSGSNDPAAGTTNVGATELYAVLRNVMSGNKISGTNNFSWGPINDIGWETGVDLETKNTAFAPEKRLIVFGPQFQLAVPDFLGGKDSFFNLSLHGAHEWNNNGFSHCTGGGVCGPPGGSVDFAPTFEMETAYDFLMPFSFMGYKVKFKGFANLVAPKGKTGFGTETKTEILVHPKLMVDFGEVIPGNKDRLEAGIGFEYWYNKFGNDHNITPGSIQMTPLFQVSYKF
jgi:hypothetical protein